VKYAALLLGILAVMGMGVRPALARAGNARPAKAGGKELPGATAKAALAAAEAPPPGEERGRSQEIFDQVQGQVKRDPAQTSRLLQSWIHSE
jgi:flagellar M-ring protein FliF